MTKSFQCGKSETNVQELKQPGMYKAVRVGQMGWGLSVEVSAGEKQ